MPAKKDKTEPKYLYVQKFECRECKTVAEVPGPCEKCGKMIFYDFYEAREI